MRVNYAVRRLTLNDMIRSRGFESFISDRLGNGLFLDDPDRADRIHEYAEDGGDGSTHAEVIEDWRDYLCILTDNRELPARVADRIEDEITACEEWHERNGSLFLRIG